LKIRKEVIVMMVKQMQLEIIAEENDKYSIRISVLIKPGEKIPADGIIVKGTSHINESMLTGESVPVEKDEGDSVIGGSINGDGSLVSIC
jgi:Cu2+-exporting ATPase